MVLLESIVVWWFPITYHWQNTLTVAAKLLYLYLLFYQSWRHDDRGRHSTSRSSARLRPGVQIGTADRCPSRDHDVTRRLVQSRNTSPTPRSNGDRKWRQRETSSSEKERWTRRQQDEEEEEEEESKPRVEMEAGGWEWWEYATDRSQNEATAQRLTDNKQHVFKNEIRRQVVVIIERFVGAILLQYVFRSHLLRSTQLSTEWEWIMSTSFGCSVPAVGKRVLLCGCQWRRYKPRGHNMLV